MTLTKVWGAVALIVCSAGAAWAQGDIEGLVKDQSGAIVPSAAVTIRSVETGAERKLTTDERGYFLARLLALGEYDVRVEAERFKPSVQRVLVRNAETASLNIPLEVGQVTEVVEVTATGGQLLTTTDAQIALSIEEKRVKDLPLIARNPLILATLSAGVVPVTPDNPFLGAGSFNSNGGRGRGNNITIDNVVATDISTTGSAGLGTLSLDAIQEFKLITNNFNAEFGRNASAQVQILTKGGSNNFHGVLYEFLRNDALNARDYFDRTGKASTLRRNQFGATVGGPIYRDRLFYFGHYEGLQIRGAGATRTAPVPTPAQRAAVTDPTSQAILNDVNLPLPESIDPSGAFGIVSQRASNATKSNAFSARVDHLFNESRDRITARYAFEDSEENSASLTFVFTNLAGFGASSIARPQNASFGWTHIFGQHLVNDARFAFGRSNPNFPPQFTKNTPRINITGFTGGGFGESDIIPQGRTQNTFQYSDVLSFTSGRHNWKFGADVHRIHANSFFDANLRGTLTFASWNDFANGVLQSYSQRFGNSVRENRVTNVFAFAQDDFKVSQDLTLNLGFRLEVAGGVSEVNGILANLDLTSSAPIGGAGAGPLGSFVLGGSSNETNYNLEPRLGIAWNPGRGRWVVRGGYGVTHDFIFLNPITNLRFAPPFMVTVAQSGAASFTGANSYANIVAGTAQIQADARAGIGQFNPTQVNFGNFSPVSRDLDNPRMQQWNLTVERQLTSNLAAKLSYVGTAGARLLQSRHVNMIPQGTVAPATSEADEVARLAQFQSVFAGSTGSPTSRSNRIDGRFNAVTVVDNSASSRYHALEAEVVKTFSDGYQFQATYTWSKSIDNVSDVLGVLRYDVAAAQNPFNLADNRAVSQFDVPHRLVINHVYEPQFFRNTTGVARKLLHGWGFNGIFQTQSGYPANIIAGTRFGINDISLSGNTANAIRASVVGDLDRVVFAPSGTPEARNIPTPAQRGVNATAADRNTNTSNYPLVQPLLGTFGTLGRNVLRLNGLTNFDWVFLKNTPIREEINLQFRAEFYNVFNNTSFSSFVNNLSSANFGTYEGTDTIPRQIQLALKLIW